MVLHVKKYNDPFEDVKVIYKKLSEILPNMKSNKNMLWQQKMKLNEMDHTCYSQLAGSTMRL